MFIQSKRFRSRTNSWLFFFCVWLNYYSITNLISAVYRLFWTSETANLLWINWDYTPLSFFLFFFPFSICRVHENIIYHGSFLCDVFVAHANDKMIVKNAAVQSKNCQMVISKKLLFHWNWGISMVIAEVPSYITVYYDRYVLNTHSGKGITAYPQVFWRL